MDGQRNQELDRRRRRGRHGQHTHKTAVGFAEATDSFSTFPATFAGQSVDNTTVLLRYTYYGDADVSGNVNLVDFGRLASNFGQTGRRWAQGDFNFDGNVNVNDFSLLAGNMGQTGLGDDFGGGGGGQGNRPSQGGGEGDSDEYYTYDQLWEMLMEITGGG